MPSTSPAAAVDWVLRQPDLVNAWVDYQGGGRAWPESYEAFGVARGQELVAGLVFYDYNGSGAFVNVAVTDRRAFRRLLRLGFAYAFEQLALHRLTFVIACDNLPSIALARALGATHEATLREAGREKVDLHIYALFAESCELWRRLRGKKCTDSSPGRLRQADSPANAGE